MLQFPCAPSHGEAPHCLRGYSDLPVQPDLLSLMKIV